MFQKRFALLAEAGDGDGVGDGAPNGGSPEGGQDKSGGGENQVPESRLKAALADQERRLKAEFEAKLAEATKPPKADQPKRYTRAQLRAAVDAGQISQDEADAHLEQQLREDLRADVLNTHTAVERRKLVDSEVTRYTAVAPEILDEGNGTREEIRKHFNGLVALGDDPKDVATQLKAIRAVLGPIERLERARSGRSEHDTHRETGSGGGAGGGRQQKTGKLVDQLNADARKQFEKQIERGIVKDWAEVESQLKYASPSVRQRLGIAA